MSSSVLMSNGTVFKGGGSAVGDVISIKGAQMSRPEIDTTCLSDVTATNNVGILDCGTIDLELNGTAANYTTLKGYMDSTSTVSFAIVDTGSATDTQVGHLIKLSRDFGLNQKVKINATVRITGGITTT